MFVTYDEDNDPEDNKTRIGRLRREQREATFDALKWGPGSKSALSASGVSGREYNYLDSYDIDCDDYEQMYWAQDGCCKICSKAFPLNGKGHNRLHVDHNHDTTQVRALLCLTCNMALGSFKDSPELCRLAAAYLEYYNELAAA